MDPFVFEFADPVQAVAFAGVVGALPVGHKVRHLHRVVDVTLPASADPAFLRGSRDLLLLAAECREGRLVTDPLKPGRARLPRGFRRGHSDDLACPHRDVSCCPVCAEDNPEILEIYGQHFWMPDAAEREGLRSEMAATKPGSP